MTNQDKVKQLVKFSQNSQLAIFEQVQALNNKFSELADKLLTEERQEPEQLTPILTELKTLLEQLGGKDVPFDEINTRLDTLISTLAAKNLTVEVKDRTDDILLALRGLQDTIKTQVPIPTPPVDFTSVVEAIKAQPVYPVDEQGRLSVRLVTDDIEKLGKSRLVAFGGGGAQLKVLGQLQTLNAGNETLNSIIQALSLMIQQVSDTQAEMANIVYRLDRDLMREAIIYARDTSDQMKVYIGGGASTVTQYWGSAGSYPAWYGTGSPNSMDARESELTQLNQLFEQRRSRWNFS